MISHLILLFKVLQVLALPNSPIQSLKHQSTPYLSQKLDFLPSTEAFLFNVDCNDLVPYKCQQAKLVLKSAGMRIANQLQFRRQIVVNVEFLALGKKWSSGRPAHYFSCNV